MNDSAQNKKRYITLWLLSILGSLSVLPYMSYLGVLPLFEPIWKIALLSGVQAALFFGVICWISFKILPKTDLNPFPIVHRENLLKKIVFPALISGILVGIAILVFDKTIFASSPLSKVHPPLWAGALASIYGAVNEEVLLRLFLFTFCYFLVGKCLKIGASNRPIILWGVNIFVALLFGVGHLPAAFKLGPLSSVEVVRVLFLNAVAGVVFGWLYWSRGIGAAIISHFAADFILHVF